MNEFKLLGRVNYTEIKYTDSGKVFTRILLGEKKRGTTDEYQTFAITFFNTKNYATAEKLAEEVKKGDYIIAEGKLNVNKWKDQATGKDKEKIELLGFGYKLVTFSKEENKFVEITKEVDNEKFSTVEKTPELEDLSEEIPF